jgi:hypothetical protein
MVVEEDCIVTREGDGAPMQAGTQWKKGISPIVRSLICDQCGSRDYERSKFISRIHDVISRLAMSRA